MNTKSNREQITAKRASALAIVLGGGAGLVIIMQGLLSFALPTQAETIASVSVTEEIRSVKILNPFDGIILEAHAVYVLDVKTGAVLFARNENEKLPLASVTKLMTALIAREHISSSAVITLSNDDISAEGDSGLRASERWRTGDLLNMMLLVSSNDAAHAVAWFVGSGGKDEVDSIAVRDSFVKMMNEKARVLGLTQMEFFNESGLDVDGARNGGYGSAHDVAILFSELWKKYPETVEMTAHKEARIVSQDNITHVLSNTNEIVGQIPGLIASKTGYTVLAGGNLAVIFDNGIGEPVVVVVLGSSYNGRFDDMKKLVESTRKTL